MKKVFVRDIKEKDSIQEAFLVARKETGISKTGKAYLNLKLMDSSGSIEARVWDDAEEVGKGFGKNDIVAVRAYAVAYQGGVQLNVSSARLVPEAECSLRDFLPASSTSPEELASGLDSVIGGIRDRHLKALLQAIFTDPEIRGRFLTAPAAKAMHHSWLGGLAEHVLSICSLADRIAGHYGPSVNRDLLAAGALLHDIGKIYELEYKRAFDYTDEGRLLGHITIGVELIDRKAAGIPDFPAELLMLIKHIVLSHHGQLEYGSPKRPKTIEAIILSYLDDLDAKVNTVSALISDRDADGSNWTSYQKLFERYIYKGSASSAEDALSQEDGPAPDKGAKGKLTLF